MTAPAILIHAREVLSLSEPSIIGVALLLTAIPASAFCSATGRRLAAAIAFLITLHGLVWYFHGTAPLLQAGCAALGCVMGAMTALRSTRNYPLPVVAALLIVTIAQFILVFRAAHSAAGAEAYVLIGNALLAATLWAGLICDRLSPSLSCRVQIYLNNRLSQRSRPAMSAQKRRAG